MLQNISIFFEKYLNPTVATSDGETVDKIHLACAALMIEICKADYNIDDTETKKISAILREKFDLPEETLTELFDLAKEEADEATSLYQFTSLINEAYEYPAKIALIKDMWEIAFADGDLDRYEEHLIRKVTDLLYVSHSDFIKTKIAAKNTDKS